MTRPRAPRRVRASPALEVAMTAPLFVVYQLGLLVLDVRNGADWLTSLLMALLDASVVAYVGFVVLVALVLRAIARRETKDPEGTVKRTIAESLGLAIVLVLLVGLASRSLAEALVIPADSILGAILISAGAGFHEELLFRVGLFGGGSAALAAAGVRRGRALAIAATTSSFLFALAHHVGPFGEPLAFAPLALRFLSGLYFCGILRYRGFATAAYTHALYDVIVLVLLR